ncbi:unnamed protein product, partial [marine sediment metagenome]
MDKDLFELYQSPQLRNPSLIVAWQNHDVGRLGSKIIQFLNAKLGCQKIAEIKPQNFFPLGGAVFKD